MSKSIYTKNCKYCQTEFVPLNNKRKFCSLSCSCKFNGRLQKRKNKNCLNCNKEFYPNHSTQRFCCIECFYQYPDKKSLPTNNRKKAETRSYENLYKYSYTKLFKLFEKASTHKPDKDIVGPYSIYYFCTCRHCKKLFSSKIRGAQYCKEHKHLYTDNSRAMYRFKIDVYDYPDLFPVEKINEKIVVTNINGWVLDHRVTIFDAIHNNYDPYYIKHPVNYQLMTHQDNMIKGRKSSISYKQLIKEVDEYEKMQ